MIINMIIKLMFILGLLIIVLFIVYTITEPERCINECKKDDSKQMEANITGHGIDHTCYDYCSVHVTRLL